MTLITFPEIVYFMAWRIVISLSVASTIENMPSKVLIKLQIA